MRNRTKATSAKFSIGERRTFLKTAVLGGVGLAAQATFPAGRLAGASAEARRNSETLVATLNKSLSEEQRKVVTFPFDHPLRSKVDNNWAITPYKINQFYTADQQAMIIAIFGRPATGKFEFVLTGRHCTMRCDGDSVEGAAFGGPIFYGHAARDFNEAPDHPGNVYWYQAKSANRVFQALDGKQRQLALLTEPRQEQQTRTVRLGDELAGLPVSEMSRDQVELVEQVLADLLLPFRRQDAEEAMRYIKKEGKLDGLTLSFYKSGDLGNDGIWDNWQLQSRNMVWYFRGSPHVHVWVNIKA